MPVSRPAAVLKEPSEKEKKSLAQMILMRESLAGLPRASLSGLFRQSLSIAELDRMFEVIHSALKLGKMCNFKSAKKHYLHFQK